MNVYVHIIPIFPSKSHPSNQRFVAVSRRWPSSLTGVSGPGWKWSACWIAILSTSANLGATRRALRGSPRNVSAPVRNRETIRIQWLIIHLVLGYIYMYIYVYVYIYIVYVCVLYSCIDMLCVYRCFMVYWLGFNQPVISPRINRR